MSSHIDSANEVLTLDLPLIKEPDDQEQEEQQQEDPPRAIDPASEEANPSEEGRQDHTSSSKIYMI